MHEQWTGTTFTLINNFIILNWPNLCLTFWWIGISIELKAWWLNFWKRWNVNSKVQPRNRVCFGMILWWRMVRSLCLAFKMQFYALNYLQLAEWKKFNFSRNQIIIIIFDKMIKMNIYCHFWAITTNFTLR